MEDYNKQELDRMAYHLKEMEELYIANPKSLTLRNGIAEIRKRLGKPQLEPPVDSGKFIQTMIDNKMNGIN